MSSKSQAEEESKPIKVQVLFFGAARDAAGKGELELSLTDPATARNVLDKLFDTFPDLRRFGRSLLIAVNQEYANPDVPLNDGDEIALFPPVSGGGEKQRRLKLLLSPPHKSL
jgi:molybdopterin converting factor subunit 1